MVQNTVTIQQKSRIAWTKPDQYVLMCAQNLRRPAPRLSQESSGFAHDNLSGQHANDWAAQAVVDSGPHDVCLYCDWCNRSDTNQHIGDVSEVDAPKSMPRIRTSRSSHFQPLF